MTIKLLKQTKRMNCAQTAVAMAFGKTIKQVEKAFGQTRLAWFRGPQHIDPKGRAHGSKTGLQWTRFVVENMMGGVAGDLTTTLPQNGTALVRVVFHKRSGGVMSAGKTKKLGHLVAWRDGVFYDPCGFSYTTLPEGMAIDKVMEVLVP
jgi:hypothetical protein